MTTAFIDSGVVWRALDPLHPQHRPCLDVLRKAFLPKPLLSWAVNAVVIVETMLLLVGRSKIPAGQASRIIWDGFLKSEERVVNYPVDRMALKAALDLNSKEPSIEYPDCVIAATMKENELKVIYTSNPSHFRRFDFIKEALDPVHH
jgi:predicted nucleic acid-binding protein